MILKKTYWFLKSLAFSHSSYKKGNYFRLVEFLALTGMTRVPSLMSSTLSCGCAPSTVHPTLWHVPSISLTVPKDIKTFATWSSFYLLHDYMHYTYPSLPCRCRAIERGLIVLAISMTWSIVMLPLCFTTKNKSTITNLHSKQLTVFCFLPITRWFFQSFYNESSSTGHYLYFSLAILNNQFNSDP